MKEIKLLKVHMENFKKFHDETIEFGQDQTSVYGRNYIGKSSIADSFSWVMFNKSSTGNTEGSQFRPRRYDENGINIDHVDVVVELLLLVDGEEVKIKKTQHQDWVRHRGDDFDSYMGDKTLYEWNDVPTTPTDHKKKVADIISEDVFRMISNPASFPSENAKKQREFLLKNVANITDDDVFESNADFSDVKEAMAKNTLEELAAKTKKEIAAYKKKMEEIPVRIDQESKRIEDVDFSAKEKELAELQSQLKDNEAKMEDAGNAYGDLNKMKAEKAQLEGKLIEIKSRYERESKVKEAELQKSVDEAANQFKKCFDNQKTLESTVNIDKSHIQTLEKDMADLKEQYMLEMSKELSDDAYICPTCGQEIPEKQRETIKDNFDQKKAQILKEINERGSRTSADLKETKESMDKRLQEIEELKKGKIEAQAAETKARKELENFVNAPSDLMNDKEYMDTKAKIEKLDADIKAFDTANADAFRDALKMERDKIQASMDEVKESLALKSVIEKSKETVKELTEEMKEVTQNLANCEKLESQIDKFNHTKMDMLSERINDKFKVVTWKLFEQQKNGRFAETCVCMIHGSCYGENTTSATERMMAGMDIINTLQDIYQVKAPIFLDDADLYNDWNIPVMDCQLIKLCVSEDEEIRVEVE